MFESGLDQQFYRLIEGLSKGFLWTLAALSLIFSPILVPDHFQMNKDDL